MFDNTKDASSALERLYNGALAETAVDVCVEKSNVYGFRLENNHSAIVYVQFFDAAAADVTVGTTPPIFTIRLPASGEVFLPPQRVIGHFPDGCSIACTATRTGNGAPGAAAGALVWFSQR